MLAASTLVAHGEMLSHGWQVIVAEFDHGHGLSLAQSLCSSVMAMSASYTRPCPPHIDIWARTTSPFNFIFVSSPLGYMPACAYEAGRAACVPFPSFAASSGLNGLIPSLVLGYINGHRLGRGFRCLPPPPLSSSASLPSKHYSHSHPEWPSTLKHPKNLASRGE